MPLSQLASAGSGVCMNDGPDPYELQNQQPPLAKEVVDGTRAPPVHIALLLRLEGMVRTPTGRVKPVSL
jgi:hypothetical protein